MKRVFTLLLIACSTILSANAQKRIQPVVASNPNHVIERLNKIITDWGANGEQVYSVHRNPNTNLLQSKVRVVNFHLKKSDFDNLGIATAIAQDYIQDEHLSYSLEHVKMGDPQLHSIIDMADNGQTRATYRIRSNTKQEMWVMCVKNHENPRLRDAYAITWQFSPDLRSVDGTIFLITSLRPDLFATNISERTPRMPRKVGEPWTAEEIKAIPMEKFQGLDVPNDMKDGFVGGLDVVADTVVIDTLYDVNDTPLDNVIREPNPIGVNKNFKEASGAQMEMMIQSIMLNREFIKQSFGVIREETPNHYDYKIDMSFEQIYKQNKALDKKYQDLIKFVTKHDMPARDFPSLYKEILSFYTEETKIISEFYKNYGSYTKSARKTQNYINSLIEKYMDQMTKSIK